MKRNEFKTWVIKDFILSGIGWIYKVKENEGVKLGEQWFRSLKKKRHGKIFWEKSVSSVLFILFRGDDKKGKSNFLKVLWINLDFRREVIMGNVYLKQTDIWICEGTRVGIIVMSVRYE